jgi:hypothetical protein
MIAMTRRYVLIVAGLLLVAGILDDGRALQARGHGRTYLTLTGRVTSVEVIPDEAKREWVVAVIEPESDLPEARIRIAPRDVLAAQEYEIEAGQRLKVRVFTDESPYLAQQIRNQENGRVLRLRSLRGEPLWNSGRHHHGRGAGHESHHGERPDRGRSAMIPG